MVPRAIGVIATINKKKLDALLQNSIPDGLDIGLPASAVVLEYIEQAQRASPSNMTDAIAEEALRGLQLIHNAHVLHNDGETRNMLVYPESGKVVWIDFSSAEINRSVRSAIGERTRVKLILYVDTVLTSHSTN